jgi:hypothetical protein
MGDPSVKSPWTANLDWWKFLDLARLVRAAKAEVVTVCSAFPRSCPLWAGLVFIAAAMDNYLRAFDLETGRELWKGRLPAGGQATPMSYRLDANGRQFVVIAAGGHGRLETDIGDSVVAFALPESSAGLLGRSVASTLRTIGVLLVIVPTALLVFRLARRNWFW